MARSIYIGNMQWSTTEEELKEFFSNHGTVTSTQIIKDHDTGRPRGFAFVEMSNNEEATEAIKNLNGKELGGRCLKINEAKKRTNRNSFA